MITSLQNPLVKHIAALQQRKTREAAREFVVEGWRFAGEALARGAKVKGVFFCPGLVRPEGEALLERFGQSGITLEEVDERVLRKISATEEPQGILALLQKPELSWPDVRLTSRSVLLIIDGIQDPGNLGAILRTALAAGVDAVLLTKGTVDPYNPKALRGTMGAIFSLTVLADLDRGEIAAFCRKNALPLVVGDISGDILYSKGRLPLPLALVVGNEGSGPDRFFRDSARQRLTIPMASGVESLNVATATAIMLFEIVRQRDFL